MIQLFNGDYLIGDFRFIGDTGLRDIFRSKMPLVITTGDDTTRFCLADFYNP